MSLPSRLRGLWRNVTHRDRVERDLDDELHAAFALLVDEHLQKGSTPAEARRAAMLQLGPLDSIKTRVRDVRGGAGIETLWHDIRFSLRLLRRSRSFTVAAVASLALGMGASGTVFGLLNALRLRSLPVAHAEELAEVRLDGPRCCRHTGRNRQASLPLSQEMVRHQQAFSALFAFADTRFNLAPQGEVRYVEGLYVSGEFFPVLGVAALAGRMLTPADDRAGCANAPAVISHALWQGEFGGAEDVLSRTLSLRSGRHPIVGIVPPTFLGVEVGRRFEVALPLCAAGFDRRDHWWLAVMGRLAPGWTTAAAEAHLATLGPSLLEAVVPSSYGAEQAKDFRALRFSVHAAGNGISPLRTDYENPLWLLFGIAALVFLTACANVASLSLVRATARQPELAMRFALGATRFRVIRQLVVEGALIGVAGAIAGVALAGVAIRVVTTAISTSTDPIVLDVGPDWRMVMFHAVIVALTTAAFALGPGLLASGWAHTHDGSRSTESRRRVAVREILVSVQVAMSVVLVSAALLFVLTFRNLNAMDVGFTRQHVLVANVFLSEQDHPPATRATFLRDLTSRFAAIPGVAAAAFTTTPPLGGTTWGTVVLSRTAAGEIKGEVVRNQVGNGYFSAMEMPVVSGRPFTDGDTPQSPRVAIVNESFARRFFPDTSPLGQRFMDGADEFEVVGLVRDSKQYFVREEFRPISYTAASQLAGPPPSTMRFVIRSGIGTAPIIDSVRRAITDASPSAGIRFAAMADQTAQSIGREQLMATLSAFFGITALALAAVGVFGVVSYTSASRQREIGIRLALGARAPDVLRSVFSRLALTSGVGLAAGLIVTASVSAMAASFLYGVEARDTRLLTLTAGVVGAAALAAAVVPVRRALATDPVQVMKAE
jgi:putative ABC transport system permease protein